MAKRRRLTPASTTFLSLEPEEDTGSIRSHRPAPPIAQVVEESSEAAALSVLSEEFHKARQEGRMIQRLSLACLKEDFLVRDRISIDENELDSLVASLRERGQQAPIDVAELPDDQFGLISGWRRVTALKKLFKETGEERFSTVLAIVRKPEASSDAYRSMVEENEVRLGLSYYERARIAAKAAEQGVFADKREAIKVLYAAASRAKRSKISSFLEIYYALDGHLNFPGALPERQGLLLAKALTRDKNLKNRLKDSLRKAQVQTSEAELALLARAVSKADAVSEGVSEHRLPTSKTSKDRSHRESQAVLIDDQIGDEDPVITLRGPGINQAFLSKLRKWVKTQTG